jgi:hypothetical protein
MGSIDKRRFHQYKTLLRLSDEAMELADRHDIDEKKLRYVVALPAEFHDEIVRQIIDLNLTSKQVKEICEGSTDDHQSDDEQLPSQALKLARIAQISMKTSPQDLARALIQQEGDSSLARARLQAMRKLLSDAEKYLTE